MKDPALLATIRAAAPNSTTEMTIAAATAAVGGRAGTRRRITRAKPSTITAMNTARSRGEMMPPIQRRAAPVAMTARTTRALRAVTGDGTAGMALFLRGI